MNTIPSRVAARLGDYLARIYLQPNVRPFAFQLPCLSWMQFREMHELYGVRGGILGLPMGAGKTFVMLLLVLFDRLLTRQTPTSVNREEQAAYVEWQALYGHEHIKQHPATLVLVTKEAKRAWMRSINKLFRPNTFRCATVASLDDLTSLPTDIDLAFLSTGLVSYKSMPSIDKFSYRFRRLIYDEVHDNATPTTDLARGVAMLPALFRWGMTASLITNSLSDALTVLHTVLRVQDPLLLKWASATNPATTINGLQKEGIDMNYVDCLLLGLCLVRPRTANNDPISIHETAPADLYSWLTCVPPSANLALSTLIRYPSLAWELAELVSPVGRHVRDQYYDKVRRERLAGYQREGLDNVAVMQMCRDFGVQVPVPNETTTTMQQSLRQAGNVYQTAYLNAPLEPRRILLRAKLYSPEKLSPSHRHGLDRVEGVQALFDSYKHTQRVYTALASGIVNSSSSSTTLTLALSIRPLAKSVVFYRPSVDRIERAALQHLNDLYLQVCDTKNSDALLSPLNIPTFAREVAFHLDLLLLTRREEAIEIFRDCPVVRDYYKRTWAEAQNHHPRHLQWIAKTAWTRLISTKLRMMIEYWALSVHKDERVVCFCFFLGALSILEALFADHLQVECRTLRGNDDEKTRERVLDEMATLNGPRILFAAEDGFAESGNMEFANHSWHPFVWWNKRHEDQGKARLDRPGQQRQIYGATFLLTGGIDEFMRKRAEAKELLRSLQQQHGSGDNTAVATETLVDRTELPVSALRVVARPDQYRRNQPPLTDAESAAVANVTTATATRDIEHTHRRWSLQARRALLLNIRLAPLAELEPCDAAAIATTLNQLPVKWQVASMALTPLDEPPSAPPSSQTAVRATVAATAAVVPKKRRAAAAAATTTTTKTAALVDALVNEIDDDNNNKNGDNGSEARSSGDMDFLLQELRRMKATTATAIDEAD